MYVHDRSKRSTRGFILRARAVTAVLCATTMGLLYILAISPAASADTYIGSSLSEGAFMYAGDYLLSPNGNYKLELQSTDGNLVLYNGGTALWASGTAGNANDYATLQTDGNFVIYSSNGVALWNSHTYTFNNNVLSMQDDGNAVIYSGSTPLWNTATASNEIDCWNANSCNSGEFAWAILGIPPEAPYAGVNAPLTLPNNFAVSVWQNAEGTSCAYNPLATTQAESGSSQCPYVTSAPVQQYTDWYWGIVATDQTLSYQSYTNIVSTLNNPNNSSYTQCTDLAAAVGNSPWGTGNFSADC